MIFARKLIPDGREQVIRGVPTFEHEYLGCDHNGCEQVRTRMRIREASGGTVLFQVVKAEEYAQAIASRDACDALGARYLEDDGFDIERVGAELATSASNQAGDAAK